MSEDKLKEAALPYQTKPFRNKFQPLINQLYHKKILKAHKITPKKKFLTEKKLFKYTCSITLTKIKNQNPEFNKKDYHRELKQRLKLQEQIKLQKQLKKQR